MKSIEYHPLKPFLPAESRLLMLGSFPPKKDEPDATQVIDSKKNGQLVPKYYGFGNVSYSLSIYEEGDASLSVIDKGEQ